MCEDCTGIALERVWRPSADRFVLLCRACFDKALTGYGLGTLVIPDRAGVDGFARQVAARLGDRAPLVVIGGLV